MSWWPLKLKITWIKLEEKIFKMAAEWRNASRSTEAQLNVINTLSRYHLFIPYQFLTVSMLLQKQSVWKSILVFGGSFSIKKWINSYESLKLDLSCSRPPLYLLLFDSTKWCSSFIELWRCSLLFHVCFSLFFTRLSLKVKDSPSCGGCHIHFSLCKWTKLSLFFTRTLHVSQFSLSVNHLGHKILGVHERSQMDHSWKKLIIWAFGITVWTLSLLETLAMFNINIDLWNYDRI